MTGLYTHADPGAVRGCCYRARTPPFYTSLLKLVPPQIVHAYAEAMLGPVRVWDEKHTTDLMTTLECFIRHDGRLQATATDLGIHQNTLRFRLDRIAQLSGRRFESIRHRIDLTIALDSFG